jgi:hypothetical protein
MTRGVAGKGSRRGAAQGQTYTKDRTGLVALGAALESAVQLGRGDEVNRQAEIANSTKCTDSARVPGSVTHLMMSLPSLWPRDFVLVAVQRRFNQRAEAARRGQHWQKQAAFV